MPTLEPHAETRRVLRHLRDVIEDADMTQRQIESRAGFSRGYLSQLLAQNIDLKYRHVLAVLEAVGIAPATFFARVFPPPESRPPRGRPLELPPDHQAANVYGFGIEAVQELRQRLERCEDALVTLHESGVIDDGSPRDGEP
ncbi:MAG: XRE family transcriptional regulator [Acidobacteria bacterium]|nr:MAG: XRE family transcriptional regulator [Acidobacteriota bacterium]